MAFDYGTKRTGIAVTDPGRMIATGLKGIETSQLFAFIAEYVKREPVGMFLIGFPLGLNGLPTHSTEAVTVFIRGLEKRWPQIARQTIDERFSSKDAVRALVQRGVKKKARRNKHLVDEVSATLLLQEFLQLHILL